MRNNIFIISFIILFIFLNGCAPILKKFVRKRRRTQSAPLYLKPREYPSLSNKELYNEYFVYIRGWMQELIQALKDKISRKKIIASCKGVIENLTYLKSFFHTQPHQLKKIDFYIKEYTQIQESFEKGNVSSALWEKFIYRAEKLQRDFEKDFRYSKVSG